MGYNTTVVVMNDALSMIRDDPTFGTSLHDAICEVQRGHLVDVPAYLPNGRGVHTNAATVIETHHADGTAIVAVGGNTGTSLGIMYPSGDEDYEVSILRELADKLGYKISKKPTLVERWK